MHLDRLKVVQTVAELGFVVEGGQGTGHRAIRREPPCVAAGGALGATACSSGRGRGVALSEFGLRVLPQIGAVLMQAGRLQEVVSGRRRRARGHRAAGHPSLDVRGLSWAN